MSESDLLKKLQNLYNEIEKTEVDDTEKQATLNDLKIQIEKVLAEPDGEYRSTLAGRLRNALLSFEVGHPQLTTAMEMVSEHLSSLGI